MVPLEFRELLHELLAHASRTDSRCEVLRRICTSLLHFSACDRLSIRIDEGGRTTRCQAWLAADGSERVEAGVAPGGACGGEAGDAASADPIPETIVQAVLSGRVAAPTRSFTRGRSFWLGDTARPLLLHEESAQGAAAHTVVIGGEFPSVALVPVDVSGRTRAMLFFASRRRDFFSSDDIQVYEAVAQTLGVALAHQGAQWALRERVKELTCLYHISQLAQAPGLSLDELLARIVALLPPAWQYPDHASARAVLDGRQYCTEPFKDGPHRQSAPVIANGRHRGRVELFYSADVPNTDDGPFLKEEQRLIAAVAETIAEMVGHHEAQWALRERVKELTCLYGIAKLASRPGISLEEFLAEVVKLLPPGWQYPDIARARITLDGRSFSTPGFEEARRQAADIWIDGVKRGAVEVAYAEEVREADEGPFLKEERSLIDEIARQVGLTVEHFETEVEASRLQEQLRHAERLATVGQLSAGVAHELNEPLGAVLGFAELLKQGGDLPGQSVRDVDRIIRATLHAREIIRKLMIFTRQMPTRKEPCDLNQIVAEGLYLLESRCAKDGVELVRHLGEPLPPVTADPSQLHQVLVNLVVNAIQAMPGGGRLTIATRQAGDRVVLSVADTGTGMSPEVQRQLFVPFFSTKEVGHGTGLGLAVVHGIVTAHGGTVSVSSEVGKGSCFELSIPVQGQGSPKKGS